MDSSNSQGVYFLANDVIVDWSVAFLESFRAFNPDMRLIMIPFDKRIDRLAALAPKYRFEILNHPSFAALEEIGYTVCRDHLRVQGAHLPQFWYRRFAAFLGPLDEFLYLDGRTLVLCDVREILQARRDSGCDLLHYDSALNEVYRFGSFRTQLLRERRAHGFLSGMWASRRGLFELSEMQALAQPAAAVREHLNIANGDQPFLNFICDTKPVTYASFADVMPDVSATAWAWVPGIYQAGSGYRRWDHGGIDHNHRVLIVHWAGKRLNAVMPHRWLFLRYRLRSEPLAKRLAWRGKWALQYPFLKIVDLFRRSRRANLLYHTLRHRLGGHELPHALRPLREQPANTAVRQPEQAS